MRGTTTNVLLTWTSRHAHQPTACHEARWCFQASSRVRRTCQCTLASKLARDEDETRGDSGRTTPSRQSHAQILRRSGVRQGVGRRQSLRMDGQERNPKREMGDVRVAGGHDDGVRHRCQLRRPDQDNTQQSGDCGCLRLLTLDATHAEAIRCRNVGPHNKKSHARKGFGHLLSHPQSIPPSSVRACIQPIHPRIYLVPFRPYSQVS